MDVTEQVNMEPPPQCQLSQSGFSHYLVLSPRKSAEGQERILLSDARGMEKAGLRGSRMAEGRGEQPTGSSAPAGSGPLLGAATWDPARVDSALSWPKVQGGGALGGGGSGVAGWGLNPPHCPALHCPNPAKQGTFPLGGARSLLRQAVFQEESHTIQKRLVFGKEAKRTRGSRRPRAAGGRGW